MIGSIYTLNDTIIMNVTRIFCLLLFGMLLASPVYAQDAIPLNLTIFTDTNKSGGFDAGDVIQPGATVTLEDVSGGSEITLIADDFGKLSFSVPLAWFANATSKQFKIRVKYAGTLEVTQRITISSIRHIAGLAINIPVIAPTSIPANLAKPPVQNPATTKAPDVSPFGP